MNILLAPITAWFLAQVIKTILVCIQEKRWCPEIIFASGGMPSSHTAGVVALTIQVAMTEGVTSAVFAVAFMFSAVVIYDALHVRRSTGEQAIAFNLLLEKLYGEEMSEEERVREVLGHTPLQVLVGFGIGIACGVLIPTLSLPF